MNSTKAVVRNAVSDRQEDYFCEASMKKLAAKSKILISIRRSAAEQSFPAEIFSRQKRSPVLDASTRNVYPSVDDSGQLRLSLQSLSITNAVVKPPRRRCVKSLISG